MGDETLLDPLISPMSSVYSHVIVRDVSEQQALVASGRTADEATFPVSLSRVPQSKATPTSSRR
ncbi:MAG TPA: hypothetical protein VFV38_41655 [Ktedonobacteraceae bacterium]|nr:hypothetical protein [Ktedonobacteraceae bacterium]